MGYFFVSSVLQFYSLFIYKKHDIKEATLEDKKMVQEKKEEESEAETPEKKEEENKL